MSWYLTVFFAEVETYANCFYNIMITNIVVVRTMCYHLLRTLNNTFEYVLTPFQLLKDVEEKKAMQS